MWKQIAKTTFAAGSLDITAACTQAWLARGTTPGIVLRYLASGLFGKDAFSGGMGMIVAGLLVHFLIAFACTLVYFRLYPKWRFLQQHVLVSAGLIAVIAWAVTTRLIIPLSRIKPAPFDVQKALIAVGILYVCIGLPIGYFAKRYYTKIKTS